MTARLTVQVVEDREGQGECSNCPKVGLRWVAILSDGSAVGLECAKRLTGYAPRRIAYDWIPDFVRVAEHSDDGTLFVMWQHKAGNATRETRNGHPTQIGGVRAEWIRRGWLAAA